MWALPAVLYLIGVSVALSVIDYRTKRLPNKIVLPSIPILAALLVLPALAYDAWDAYARALAGGLAMFAVYLALAFINPKGLGMGDVKFATVVGMALAWFSWNVWFYGFLLAFVLNSVVGLAVIAKTKDRKTKLAFGPFMVIGAFLAVALGVQA